MNTQTQRSERILSLFDNDTVIPVKRFKTISRGDSIVTPKGLQGTVAHMVSVYDHVYAWVEVCTNHLLKPNVHKVLHYGIPVEELL